MAASHTVAQAAATCGSGRSWGQSHRETLPCLVLSLTVPYRPVPSRTANVQGTVSWLTAEQAIVQTCCGLWTKIFHELEEATASVKAVATGWIVT